MTARTASIVAAIFIGTAATAAGQSEIRDRSSLVINEVMPRSIANRSAWIELYNPTDSPIPLTGLGIQISGRESYEVPVDPDYPTLAGFSFLLISLSVDPGADGGYRRIRDDLLLLTDSTRSIRRWTNSSSGVLSLRRRESGGQSLVLDVVAWGGSPRADSNDLRGLWPFAAFVPAREGFGASERALDLPAGASIGRYPGSSTSTPDDWVVYDPDEAKDSKGKHNPVPRPKALSLPDRAEVGSRSVAVGWVARKGDESFRFELDRVVRDPNSETPRLREVLRVPLASSTLRVGGELPDGEYLYRVVAMSRDLSSRPSHDRRLVVTTSRCDSPMINSNQRQALLNWISHPGCGNNQECALVPNLEFRFQRKDSRLLCLACPSDTQGQNQRSRCGGGHEHPRSVRVCFAQSSSGSCFTIRAGENGVSETCGEIPGVPGQPSESETKPCEHGANYCVMAGISMMASAYGRCLSQDRIAYQATQLWSDRRKWERKKHDLRHNSQHWCGFTDKSSNGLPGGDCTDLFAWALGVGYVAQPPHRGTESDPMVLRTPPSDFERLRNWIDNGRPIMSRERTSGHVRTIGGYCVDHVTASPEHPETPSTRAWVYVFDPNTGPYAQLFGSWSKTSAETWVGPSAAVHTAAMRVRWDELGVWVDQDSDGLTDLDELIRFGTGHRDHDSDGDGISDLQEQID